MLEISKTLPGEYPAYNLAVFIGRFQPFHNAHLYVINEALKQAEFVCVLIGSVNNPRTHRNPFTYEERADMIRLSIKPEDRKRLYIRPLDDVTYNNEQWVLNVQTIVADITERLGKKVALIGCCKDSSSFFLRMFPQWGSIDVENFRSLNATFMRNVYFSNQVDTWLIGCVGGGHVSMPVREFLIDFRKRPEYTNICGEYEFVANYKSQWSDAPYPPIFVTVDACVIQSGHVLLVRRRNRPGRHLMALPGGFIGHDETALDSMIRELREETRIATPVPVLKGSIVAQKVFDDPNRSSRGRTITHGFLIHLPPEIVLPKIKRRLAAIDDNGGDDADKAQWVPLVDVKAENMFEDHAHIIHHFSAMI